MKSKVNGIFRKVCNILEWIISAILVVVVVVMCVRFLLELGGMFDSTRLISSRNLWQIL